LGESVFSNPYQIALGADNLIIITILANKLPESQRKKTVNIGLFLAMAFRIILLSMVSYILKYATNVFHHFDINILSLTVVGELSGKSVMLMVGGFFLTSPNGLSFSSFFLCSRSTCTKNGMSEKVGNILLLCTDENPEQRGRSNNRTRSSCDYSHFTIAARPLKIFIVKDFRGPSIPQEICLRFHTF